MLNETEKWRRTHFSSQITPDMDSTEVTLNGFVREIRDMGKLKFIVLADREGFTQITIKKDNVSDDIFESIGKLTNESTIAIKGVVKANKGAPRGIEILPKDIKIFTTAGVPLPMQVSEKTNTLLDTRLDWRFLDLRKHRNVLIFKIQTAAEMAMREFWIKHGFMEIHSPKLLGSPSESGAELFSVLYFDKEAYLAQSPQFYKQMAMAAGFEKVFEIAPVFRANPSHTTRHDTEYTSVDMEMSWIDSHEDVMRFEEEWMAYVISEVKKQYGKEIKEVFGFELEVPKLPFPRMSLKEAKKKIAETGQKVSFDDDLNPEEEKIIGKIVKQEFGSDFVFITEFPWKIKPFYHMRHEKTPEVTKGFDLLLNGLEITTGSQREHRHDVLEKQAKEKKLNNIKFFLDFFKYGVPPHGGFGFGLTRMLMSLLHIGNVREVTFAFRDMDRLFP